VASSKRERQRENREAGRAAQAAAAQVQKRKRSGLTVAVVSVALAAIVFLVTRGDVAKASKDTATSASSTTAVSPSTSQGGETPATPATPATPTTPTTPTTSATSATSATSGPVVPPGEAPAGCPPAAGTEARTTTFAAPPAMCIDPAKSYRAEFKTTKGDFTVNLDAKVAPKTVNNFVFLARNRYYDGVIFHRVIPGFVVQGGDPQGNGTGGPGYKFADELPAAGAYQVGSLAMANSGPDTNGSQFFVITGPQGVGLPPRYSLFGQVTAGLPTVKAIEALGSGGGTPTETVTMNSVRITES